MHNYRELKIWQRSMELVVKIYNATRNFPIEERFGLTFQIRKSVISIPSNIAEGAGRNSDPQFKHFLEISMGSDNELQTQLELARRVGYMANEIALPLIDEIFQIYRMTLTLYNTLEGPNNWDHVTMWDNIRKALPIKRGRSSALFSFHRMSGKRFNRSPHRSKQ